MKPARKVEKAPMSSEAIFRNVAPVRAALTQVAVGSLERGCRRNAKRELCNDGEAKRRPLSQERAVIFFGIHPRPASWGA